MSEEKTASCSTRKHSMRPNLLALLALSALSGCFTTHLNSFESPQQLDQLAESALVHLPLRVTSNSTNQSRGYQFLFGFLPMARVFPDSLSQIVTAKLVAHAGFQNIGLLSPESRVVLPANWRGAKVTAQITRVSINGYDLILTRRPSASIRLQATLATSSGLARVCHGSGSFSEFARFAFERDLENALEQAADAAARQVVACLVRELPFSDADSGVTL